MKALIKTFAAAAALMASFSAPTFASVQQDIIAAAGTNSVINVKVNGDTVTLTGYVEDSYSWQRAEQVAKSLGFEVENCLILSN